MVAAKPAEASQDRRQLRVSLEQLVFAILLV